MNMKVDVIESEEGPALGGAMLAAVGCGEYPDVETIARKIVKVIDTVEPEEELVAKYEDRYQKFRKIYPTVKELFKRMRRKSGDVSCCSLVYRKVVYEPFASVSY